MRSVALAVCLVAITACGHASSDAELAAPLAGSTSASAAAVATSSTSPNAPPSTAPSSAASTSTAARTTGLDVDGDGRADSAQTRFVGKHSAVLAVRLGSGKTLISKAFQLFPGDRAGTVSGYDVNGDGRAELFVNAPGADGIGYDLFSYVRSSVVAVSPPHGQEAPYLYIGGGMYYESSFGCAHHSLVQVKEAPAVASTASLPPDPPFRVTTSTYTLAGGALTLSSTRTVRVADRTAAKSLLRQPTGGCGTAP